MLARLRYLYRVYRYRYVIDPAELRFVCSQLAPGQVAVDIGCHKGAYTYWMRRCVGTGGSVYAFEPQPRQVAYLRDTFAEMRYENVEVVPMAVSNMCGDVSLHVPTGAGRTHAASLEAFTVERARAAGADPKHYASETIVVAATTLDQFFERRKPPQFLKIDVEGHELAVLEGAREIVKACWPSILIECEARHRADGTVKSVFEFLESFGYEGSFFWKGRRRPLCDFNAAMHQPMPAGLDSPPRGYVNNFAFVAKK